MVIVDGKIVLDSEAKWRKINVGAREATSYPGPTEFAGGKYASWDRGVVTMVPCRDPSKKVITADGGDKGEAVVFSLEVEVTTPEEHTERALRKFIEPYAKAYRETLPCQDA